MSRWTTLAQQQSDFLDAIFATNNIAAKAINTSARGTKTPQIRGLQTYQANAQASALRSLQAAYPVIAQLIGDDAFGHLARDFWAQHPPKRGDLAQWGGELSGFITNIPALQTEPYLSDVATAEWALHTAATAADQAADLATFALLTEHDPDALTLLLTPGTALVHSDYPIASILNAHLYGKTNFEEVGQKLRENVPETALIWRQGLRPMVSNCSASETVFIRQLLSGKSLLAALEQPFETPFTEESAPFDFNAWLPQAVQGGLLLGARLL
ncbi:MAG: hypothetical protein RL018_788 [Pseudomonadota bacterium]